MKYLLQTIAVCVFTLSLQTITAQTPTDTFDINSDYANDSLHIRIIPRKPVLAAGEVIGINLGVWSFNHFISDAPFAEINAHTIKTNLSTLPVWDTDKFSTNLIAHPYHGSLYFNAARSNGMDFWQSIPFTFGGSLMWEYFMENELPSVNDLFATTFGGVELGEITFRLSDLILDNRISGFPRVVREVVGGVASPIRGLNRVISGEAWRIRPYRGNVYAPSNVDFTLYAGFRFLAEQERSKDGEISMNVGFTLAYGELFEDEYYSPYEYFRLSASLDLFSHQPLLSRVNAIGAIWGKNVWQTNQRSLSIGIFQHFDYYDSQIKTKNKKLVSPYHFAEAAALGGGLIYQKKALPGEFFNIKQELYLNGIALGASQTDYFFVDERDYNLGSGYSIKSHTELAFKQRIALMINTDQYHIYTWKGYDPDLDLSTVDFSDLNVQGDAGNARLGVFSLKLAYYSPQKWHICLANNYYTRRTNYKYHETVEYSTSDVSLTAGYTF